MIAIKISIADSIQNKTPTKTIKQHTQTAASSISINSINSINIISTESTVLCQRIEREHAGVIVRNDIPKLNNLRQLIWNRMTFDESHYQA
jgi:hypothetical protein